MAEVASQPAWVNCHPWASFVNVRKGDAQFLAVAMQMSEASFSSRFLFFILAALSFPSSFLAINYRALAGLLFISSQCLGLSLAWPSEGFVIGSVTLRPSLISHATGRSFVKPFSRPHFVPVLGKRKNRATGQSPGVRPISSWTSGFRCLRVGCCLITNRVALFGR